jgi:hypothetical protein
MTSCEALHCIFYPDLFASLTASDTFLSIPITDTLVSLSKVLVKMNFYTLQTDTAHGTRYLNTRVVLSLLPGKYAQYNKDNFLLL